LRDIDCGKNSICNEGVCSGVGLCSRNGCICKSNSDCSDGAVCNSRGFCTNVKDRSGGNCSYSLEKMAEIMPRETILQGWSMVEKTLKNIASIYDIETKNTPIEKIIKSLSGGNSFLSESELKSIESLHKWKKIAQRDKNNKVFNVDKAKKFVNLVNSLVKRLDILMTQP